MAKKPKFKPEITRVKLNPEQAVLACSCVNGRHWGSSWAGSVYACNIHNTPKSYGSTQYWTTSSSSS